MSEAPAICQHCGTALRGASRFCPGCGSSTAPPAPSVCSACGAELRPGKAFCASCGTAAGAVTTPASSQQRAATTPARSADRPRESSSTAGGPVAASREGTGVDLASFDWTSAGRSTGLAFAPLAAVGLITAWLTSQAASTFEDFGSFGTILGGLTAGALWPLSGRFGFESSSLEADEFAVIHARPVIVLAIVVGLLIWSFKRSLDSSPGSRTIVEQAVAVAALGTGGVFVLWLVASQSSFVASSEATWHQSTSLAGSLFGWFIIVAGSAAVAALFHADALGPRWAVVRDWFAPGSQAALVAIALGSVLFFVAAVITTLQTDGSKALLLSLGLSLLFCLNGALFMLSFGTLGGSQLSGRQEDLNLDGSIDISLLSGSVRLPDMDPAAIPMAAWLIPVAAILVLLVAGALMTLRHGQAPKNTRQLGVYAGLWALIAMISYPLTALGIGFDIAGGTSASIDPATGELIFSSVSAGAGELTFYPVSALAVITIPLAAVGCWFLSDWLLSQASPATRLQLIRAAQKYPWPTD